MERECARRTFLRYRQDALAACGAILALHHREPLAMLRLPLAASLGLALCSTAYASGTFIEIQSANVQLTQVSPNGAYAVGSILNDSAFRWTALGGIQELIPDMDNAQGINNLGTIAGSVAENGGADEGGRDLGATVAVGAAPVLLSNPLTTNSSGYGISEDGTVVGLSFEDNFEGAAIAFAWDAASGMSALPTLRPQTYSRANAISADGHVIVGWNDTDMGERLGTIWIDRVPMDVADADGYGTGEAMAVTSDGQWVVGSEYIDGDFNEGAWRWSASTGVELIPDMTYAFGVSADGKTIIGATGFFTEPARTAMIWREGIGTIPFADFLVEQGITVPPGWDFAGGLTGISADGYTLAGWGTGPLGMQSYIVQLDRPDVIFQDAFESPIVP